MGIESQGKIGMDMTCWTGNWCEWEWFHGNAGMRTVSYSRAPLLQR